MNCISIMDTDGLVQDSCGNSVEYKAMYFQLFVG